MPWHSPNTVSPSAKVPPCYLMSITVNKGVPQLDARQTTSLHPLHHLAMRHHIILFRSAWPSGGGAHEQRQRDRQQDPRRCVGEGQEYAPHLPCALLEAQALSGTLRASKPRQRESQTSPRSCCCERRWIVSGSRSHARLLRSAVLANFRDLCKRSMQSSWALVAKRLGA